MADKDPGYHLAKIQKGEFGEASKIFEEIDEFDDALEQNVSLMALVELSDVIGAMKGWLAKYHPSITIQDLLAMSEVTERAFGSGDRVAEEARDEG